VLVRVEKTGERRQLGYGHAKAQKDLTPRPARNASRSDAGAALKRKGFEMKDGRQPSF